MYLEHLYSKVFLTFPQGIKKRERFCDLYVHIINRIPEEYAVHLFVSNKNMFSREYRAKIKRDVEVIELAFNDIWLGDCFPYRLDEDSLFIFQCVENQQDQDLLLTYLDEKSIIEVPLKLELGSFEMIDDVLLVSQQVYDENHNDAGAINSILEDYFEHTDVIVVNPGTTLNHIDTMFRVFDNIVLYNSTYVPEGLLAQLKNTQAGKDNRFHDVPFKLSGQMNDASECHVESYVGNAFDFLVLGDTILFPVVNEQGKKGLERLRSILKDENNDKEIIVIEHKDLEELYSLGGGLFCISGVY
jgi:agmatine/peptidylarginine deiminase